ncbi:MAG TPA: helix-turn-helix transcriptional regulator [Pseudonocardiaceae bacterium]|jgi:transcriptional regulator with XRE-family HTH domain|nr:helix-turn-helix transcriptional regulator [Pseudonocardiaceae bacterium]
MLRDIRKARGMTLLDVSQAIDKDRGLISRWENGERVPKPTDVARLLTIMQVSGPQYEEILDLVVGANEPLWLAVSLPDQRQQLTALIEFESTATTITEMSPMMVPGLLQAIGYIRAMMTAGDVPANEIEDRIATRINRRKVLIRKDPVHMVALIGEAAVRELIGGRKVMLEQLRHLQHMATLPHVEILVVPLEIGWHPGLEGQFTLIESEDVDAVVNVENRRSGLLLHAAEDVQIYRDAVDTIRGVALGAPESAMFLAAMIDRMETTE